MKHIMLLFLSEVHLDGDKKLSLSPYKLSDGTRIDCVQTNESAVRWTADNLRRQQEQLDCLFYFSTKRTQEELCYIDDENQEHRLTHEALFLDRIGSFAAHCVRIDYNERSQTEESLRQVLEMAEAIRDFMKTKSWQPEEVVLHADFTGGFRHASMMMLSVMQLLKYYGIRTTAVLYSNRNEQQVENVTGIYRMFNLISGADEFINFGSTREITAYMEGSEQTLETKRLLQTMRDFTDAVRICRTGKIAPLARELQTALKDFEKAGAVSLQEKIFLRILAIFKLEYGSLLKEGFTNLDIIRWCVEKGYLQQSMTLCSEWIPEEIVASRIFYPVSTLIQSECIQKRKKYQTWQHYFINTYTPTNSRRKNSPPSEEDDLRNVILLFGQNTKIERIAKKYPEATAKLKPLLDELFIGSKVLADMKKTGITPSRIKERYPKTYNILHSMYLKDNNSPVFHLSEEEYFKRRKLERICNYLAYAPSDVFLKLIPPGAVPAKDVERDIPVPIGQVPRLYASEAAWNIRQKQYLRMIDYSIVRYRQPTKGALEILHDYFKIRTERNNINHANAEDTRSTEEVKNLVSDLLQRLERCR